MSIATRSVTHEREETAIQLAKMDAELTNLKATIEEEKQTSEAFRTSTTALLFDISRRLNLRDETAPQTAPVHRIDSDVEENMSHRPFMGEDPQHRRHPTGPNRAIKMDMPRFHGDNPTSWLFRANLFFDYFDIPANQRVTIASIYVDGPAMDWYESQYKRGQLVDWDKFQTTLLARFGPSPFRDIRGEIAKIQQTSSVEEYYNRFVKLTNQMSDIDPRWLQSYFESGLAPAIQTEVRGRQPQTIEEALHFALLQEGHIGAVSTHSSLPDRQQHFPPSSTQPALLAAPPPRPPPQPLPALLPPPPRTPNETAPSPTIIRLNPTQMMERKTQGLCFNCDEKYHRGHTCKAKLFSFILTYDEDEAELPALADHTLSRPPDNPAITYHAFTRFPP